MKRLVLMAVCLMAALAAGGIVVSGLCGEINSPGPPTGAGSENSAMWTLDDIYRALQGDRTVQKGTEFREPTAEPAGTGHTLDDIMDKVLMRPPHPAPAAKTGNADAVGYPGSDGHLQKGVSWPTPRFTDNGNGTVTDNLTGLIWLKNANCFGPKRWADALAAANSLADPVCGLTDRSVAGDWRLPSINEHRSLLDHGHFPPTPSGPFSGIVIDQYWSSTPYATDGNTAWILVFNTSQSLQLGSKTGDKYLWPVRGGR